MSENIYNKRGVSAQKEDVHRATRDLDKGLYPQAFCKVYPDYLSGDPEMMNLLHADGAGTKSILAYMYWKETGDISVWDGIAIDAAVMNIDDMLCVGVTDDFIYSSTIGRAKSIIPGEVIERIITSTQRFFDLMKTYDIHIHFLGGETADLGDSVRTIVVDGTMASRSARELIIDNARIAAGDVIVSLASFGQTAWEQEYNSGIGSNGLTSARHDVLSHDYYSRYPECSDPAIDEQYMYQGEHRLTDPTETSLDVGKLLLSPTRTFAPLLAQVLARYRKQIHGIIHNTGGAQTKCLHYISDGLHVIKDHLIPHPPVFDLIKSSGQSSWKEMYEVFNMGNRMEIYTNTECAEAIIEMARLMDIPAQISGRVEAGQGRSLTIESTLGTFRYTK